MEKLKSTYVYLLEGVTPVSKYKLQKLIEQHKDTHDIEFGEAVKMDRHDPDETSEEDWRIHQGVWFKWRLDNMDLSKYRGKQN